MDEYYMKLALALANKAFKINEIPVGAVVVKDNKVIGCGYNKKEKLNNPLKHAEMIAIEKACKKNGDWRLNDCTLYITLAPCQMCMGAIAETRIKRVVYGIHKIDQMYYNINDIEIVGGILEKECLKILQDFFKNKRNN